MLNVYGVRLSDYASHPHLDRCLASQGFELLGYTREFGGRQLWGRTVDGSRVQ